MELAHACASAHEASGDSGSSVLHARAGSSPASRTNGESRKALPDFVSRSLPKRLFHADFRINPHEMTVFL